MKETIGLPAKTKLRKVFTNKWFLIVAVSLVVCVIAFLAFSRFFIDHYLDLVGEFAVITIDGKEHKGQFDTIDKDLTVDDKRFLSKKIVAFRWQKHRSADHQKALREFLYMIIDAAEDKHLGREEFQKLSSYRTDLVKREKVEDLFGYFIKIKSKGLLDKRTKEERIKDKIEEIESMQEER